MDLNENNEKIETDCDTMGWWTDSKDKLYQELRRYDETLADLYKHAAKTLFDNPSLANRLIIAHCVREIGNTLPVMMDENRKTGHLDYKKFIDEILAIIRQCDPDSRLIRTDDTGDQNIQALDQGVFLPTEVAEALRRLFSEHQEATSRADNSSRRLFNSLAPENIGLNEKNDLLMKQWRFLIKWFVEVTHHPRQHAQVDWNELARHFELFESILSSLLGEFIPVLDKLDGHLKEIGQETIPNELQFAEVRSLLTRSGYIDYFFQYLENPFWLEPLERDGFFRAPEAGKDPDLWPPLYYLSRIADRKMTLLQKIVRAWSSRCAKPSNLYYLILTLLRFPSNDSCKVIDDLIQGLRLSIQHVGSGKLLVLDLKPLQELILHCAKADDSQPSLRLLKFIIGIRHKEMLSASRENTGASVTPDNFITIGSYEYGEFLDSVIPELLRHVGFPVIETLSSVLHHSIIPYELPGHEQSANDYSFFWRPAIEDHEQNPNFEVRHYLISKLRDSCETLIRINPGEFRNIVESLEKQRYKIFHRLRLHLIRLFPREADKLVHQTIMKASIAFDLDLLHEYSLLVRDHFATLTPKDKEKFLSWLLTGPEPYQIPCAPGELQGSNTYTDSGINEFDEWQHRMLTILQDQLSQNCLQELSKLDQSHGQFDTPDILTPHFAIELSAQPSPIQESDLYAMSDDQLFKFLRDWRPETGFMKPSVGGLSLVLQRVVEADPTRFLNNINELRTLHPTYCRIVLLSSGEEIDKPEIDVTRVIAYLSWATRAAFESSHNELDGILGFDPGWQWAIKTVTQCFCTVVQSQNHQLSAQQLNQVVESLELIVANHSLYEERDEEILEHLSYTDIANNCVSGMVTHSLLRIWWRITNTVKKSDNNDLNLQEAENITTRIFRIILHLVSKDQKYSAVSRITLGLWLPEVAELYPGLIASNRHLLFPEESVHKQLRDWIWHPYLIARGFSQKVFTLLETEYRRDLSLLRSAPFPQTDNRKDWQRGLIRHIVQAYLVNSGDLTDSTNLISTFFQISSPDQQAFVMHFIGISLYRNKSTYSPQIIERLQTLWEFRLSSYESAPDQNPRKNELAEFGLWFISDKFDEQWALENLLKVLELGITPVIIWLSKVIERLANLSNINPDSTVTCLALIFRLNPLNELYNTKSNEVRRILLNGLNSTNIVTKQSAEKLKDTFVKEGLWQFRELKSE